ncbi:hypothetical protein CDD81_8056 [Ophiocordyceps australis]|uniref:GPI transamidase component PIG-S n=1 Tax=Ophiocordyceps australis TaxID=1399860 RepID=A0A2C5Y4A2_9HYPO|nr:hypothetical protein CDD81_8056 [Ophiocordyceps australis]
MPATAASSAATSSTQPAKPSPPEEKACEVRRRSRIVVSFWLLVLLLGLPIWWATTSIYRANLPLDRMLAWADGRACRPIFPLRIDVRAEKLALDDAAHLVRLTQHALDDMDDFSSHHLRLRLANPAMDTGKQPHSGQQRLGDQDGDGNAALTIDLFPGQETKASLSNDAAILQVSYTPNSIPSPTASSSPLSTLIAEQLRLSFAEEQAVISHLLAAFGTSPPPAQQLAHRVHQEQQQSLTSELLSQRTAKSLRYAPTYHLTLSLFTDGAVPNTWDIEAAMDEYLRPILSVLSPIHNFTIDTQVQLYATPGIPSTQHVLRKEHLASFINAAEWPLSPSIGQAPSVNFVIFVGNQTIALDEPGADAEASPTQRTSRSWLIPQWGSVYLLAQPWTATHISRETLRQPLLTFGAHLLSLLGTPRDGPLALRLSALTRMRATDLLLRAASSLGSLARLTRALPYISIPRSVADGVGSALAHLDEACGRLDDEEEALRLARVAEEEAEKAFFEKSMVGQLYFPEEHKVAVYLPLLGPVGVPLVLGLVHEVKAWWARRKRRRRIEEIKKRE